MLFADFTKFNKVRLEPSVHLPEPGRTLVNDIIQLVTVVPGNYPLERSHVLIFIN